MLLMSWYLLQTKSNGHKLAQEHLIRQGFKVFLPLLVTTSRRGVKFVNQLKPLFPGYLFMSTELCDIPWKSINATRGVSRAVSLDGRYHSIAPEIIEGIKSRCNQDGVLTSMNAVSTGDRIKIEKGPFTDFVCSVEKIAERDRVWVLMDILQQPTRTKVSLSDFARID